MSKDKIKIQDKVCRIRWVKKANMFCITIFKDGKQIIKWSKDKSELSTTDFK